MRRRIRAGVVGHAAIGANDDQMAATLLKARIGRGKLGRMAPAAAGAATGAGGDEAKKGGPRKR